jgi:hypothetical protein
MHSNRRTKYDAPTLLGTAVPSLADHHLFEQFLIVGLPSDCRIQCTYHNEQLQHEPQVIYKYPPDKPLINKMIPHFCFPNGLTTTANQRVNSGSNLNSLLYSPMAQLEEPGNSFVFLLTGEATVYYGICVLKMETLDVRLVVCLGCSNVLFRLHPAFLTPLNHSLSLKLLLFVTESIKLHLLSRFPLDHWANYTTFPHLVYIVL